MHKQKLLGYVETILTQPTAPFHEGRVREAITKLLEPCAHVQLRRDDYGSVIARYRAEGNPPPARWAFSAHMDHPGWVRPAMAEGEPEGALEFLGGVGEAYLLANRERVRDFGPFAMWDLPAFELDGERIYSRACDDLIGCSAMVALLHDLEAMKAPVECFALFTRAEEVGFIGAIEIAKAGWLAEAGLTVVSLETSSERPPAKMGAGPIIRVGDRTAIFDNKGTAELLAAAAAAGIPAQRCLMSAGTCEATAFQLYGVRSVALTIALGNYHNCGPDNRIEAEYVSLDDLANLVTLCTQLAVHTGSPASDPDAILLAQLEKNRAKYLPYKDRDRFMAQ
jgi:endoglucanase